METKKTLSIRSAIPEPFKTVFESKVNVTVDGMFTTTIPTEVAQLFENHGIALGMNRKGNKGFFESDTLAGLGKKIGEKIDELCSEEVVSREKIIQYSISTACCYTMHDGQFWPWACFGQDVNNGWRNGTVDRNANTQGPFGLSVYVKPFEKVTYSYKTTGKTRVEYLNLKEHTLLPPDTQLQWLASICGIAPTREMKIQEVPLTDETLNFFVSLLKSIFDMNEKMKPFLNPEGILELSSKLASGQQLKLLN